MKNNRYIPIARFLPCHWRNGCLILLGAIALAFLISPVHAEGPDSLTVVRPQLVDSLATDSTYTDLDEFVIISKKDIIKSDGATITYDLSEDDSSKSANLLDALRKVPMITIDGQDNIYVNGDSNYKVYVNGKDEPMIRANASKVFKAMPAASVAKIEVIIEPDAKYDAEGSGGIINLITEINQKKNGYSGTVTLSMNNRTLDASVITRAKIKNVGIDANIIYSNSLVSSETNKGYAQTSALRDPESYRQEFRQTQSNDFGYLNGALNFSWEPSSSNLFTWGASITDLDAKIKNIQACTDTYSFANLIFSDRSSVHGGLKMLTVSANASYQHNFSEQGHRFVFAYLFNFGRNPFELYNHTENLLDEDPATRILYKYNDNRTISREHTFQVDYANPFGGTTHKLETGGKAILRHNTAAGTTSMGDSFETLLPDPESLTRMSQIQDILALYASYGANFNKWAVKAGLRYEYTHFQLKDHSHFNNQFRNHLNDLVPNASLTYLFSAASNLRFSYLMRISRPTIEQMNPYQLDVLGSMVQEGNPDLKSEKSNRLSITYTNFGRVLGGNVYVEYKFTDNAIEGFSYNTVSDGQIIFHQTSANIGNVSNIGLGGFLNVNISQKMTASVSGKISYLDLRSKSPDISNHGWTGNYHINWNYTAPGQIKISAYGGQSVHMINLLGHNSGWYYYGIGISRDFLKDDALTLSINTSNFLQKYTSFKSYTTTSDFYTTNDWKNRNWRVGVSLSWTFGKSNGQPKKADLIINNDDKASSGSGGGGIGI